jgi:S-adenosylmethionine hydrolase
MKILKRILYKLLRRKPFIGIDYSNEKEILMSTWNKSEYKDLEFDEDEDGNDVMNVYVMTDNFGNIYTQIEITDLIKFIRENNLIDLYGLNKFKKNI